MNDEQTNTAAAETVQTNKATAIDLPQLVVPILAWPDRCGLWIVEHHWGMELVESFLHDDEDEDESPYAIRCHHGGDTGNTGPFMPSDLVVDIAAKTPRFIFVSDGNPFIRHNIEALNNKQKP